MSATTPTALSADFEHGLRRLKPAAIRRVASEMHVPTKTQRWTSEELLRALVEVAANRVSRPPRTVVGLPVQARRRSPVRWPRLGPCPLT